ncbi:secreted trypsin-like serine protease [Pseudomonas sp. JUb42]|uniref:trypsin-like serine protease n=1 Tax=Pseudomonas sp. JUb42 TaxID=2940611 RepID=UPI0021693010|nr:Calx-beta domain-containing protein [Pseudomonas sp. JUb42]MCS3472606.1 secreted trypsin-like serine protease [Pseudomonas sp. JUb42]
MVSTVTSYTDTRNRALTGQGYDGVVMVSVGGYYGTGVLLYDGQAVLTAAHLFSHGSSLTTVLFQTTAGSQSLTTSDVAVLSSYDATNTNNDLAIVWLNGHAPLAANRYDLYRSSDEIGQAMTLVGYGEPGTGTSGVLTSYAAAPIRQKAVNTFDADASDLKAKLGSIMSWTPKTGTQLVADFDNGATAQDALGRLIGKSGLGLGSSEGMITPGDSGGPAFINGKVAGIASYITSLSQNGVHPDIDNTSTNSSYGEIGAWQRVSAYQQTLDQAIRAHYTDAPTTAAQVKTSVTEGNTGMTNAYFLLQFTGMRTDPNTVLSVDYTTRDGTATAGQDYVAVKGTLKIYPNESQAVVAVEIIADRVVEPNETFFLDLSNPVGGSFGAGVVTLTGMRTIVNDDGVVA